MTKTQASLMSLVAALPGALLAYGMIVSFLQYADKSPLSFKIISGVTLVLGLLLALLPFAILVFGGPRAAKAEQKPADGGSVAVSAAQPEGDAEAFAETEPMDDLEVAGEADDDFEMGETFTEVESFDDAPVEHAENVDDLETFDALPVDEPAADEDLEHMETFDGFKVEDLDEEFPPEDKPKKKKK